MTPSTHSRRTFLKRMAAVAGAVAGAGVLKVQDAWAGFEAPQPALDFGDILKHIYAGPITEAINGHRPEFMQRFLR